MMKSILPVALGIGVSLLAAFGACSTHGEPCAQRLDTRGWKVDEASLWVRSTGGDQKELLLWCLRLDQLESLLVQPRKFGKMNYNFNVVPQPDLPIFLWKPGTERLVPSIRETWIAARGIPFSEEYANGLSLKFRDPNRKPATLEHERDEIQRTFRLLKNGKPVETRGRFVLRGWNAPSGGAVVAVLSTTEVKSVAGMISGGITTFGGPYYHELYDAKTGDRIGTPIELKDSVDIGDIRMCWDGEGCYAVYFDRDYQHVWIVDTGEQRKNAMDALGASAANGNEEALATEREKK